MKKFSADIEVVGLGQACIDFLGRIPEYPLEDRKVELEDVRMQCGGPASTALVTLSRLGVKTAFLGSVSDDHFGSEIIKGLERERVDFEFLKITPGYISQFAFIAISHSTGNRTIFWHRGTVPPLRAEDVNLRPFSSAKILHLDGLMIQASMEAARQAGKMGMRVVMDAGTVREGSKELTAQVDVLIASERFAESFAGPHRSLEEALSAIAALGPEEVVITMGSRGCLGWDGEKIISQKAFPVHVVDTTGAGDVYHGAYIYAMLREWPVRERMRFASAAADLKCRKAGAREGIPSLEEVMETMDRFSSI